MELHKSGDIFFCSAEGHDLEYVRAVAEAVLARYDGRGPKWRPPESEWMWPVSLGGRAGVLGVRIDGRTSCVKLFYDERVRTKVRVALGASKGRRAYRHGLRLTEAGIPCPRMLGYAERRPFGPAVLVTELAADAVRFDLWAQKHAVAREVVVAMGRFVRRLHDRGISHADLSPRNILLRPTDPAGGFLLLDYEDARFGRRVSRRTRLNNLHHLHERVVGYVPLRARLHFLRTYAPEDYRATRDALRRMMAKSGTC